MVKFKFFLSIFIFLFSLPVETNANGICVGDFLSNRMTLKGIQFCVDTIVEESSSNDIKALTSEIKEEIERKLWKEGIKVLSDYDCSNSAKLQLIFNIIKLQKSEGFVFSLILHVKQKVYLERDTYYFFVKPNYRHIEAVTWSCPLTGIVPDLDGVKAFIPQLLGVFIDAYNYANKNSK
jgi:hypothetical protein